MIPWTDEEAWTQVELAIRRTVASMGGEAAILQRYSRQIIKAYAELDMVLENVCLLSCLKCTDVCCTKATVWYDLKDLLSIYLNTGTIPDRQIFRTADHSYCNLTSSGCRLKRSDRPFICTWYICPDQKKVIDGYSDGEKGVMLCRTINKLKAARNKLEKVYIDAAINYPARLFS